MSTLFIFYSIYAHMRMRVHIHTHKYTYEYIRAILQESQSLTFWISMPISSSQGALEVWFRFCESDRCESDTLFSFSGFQDYFGVGLAE
jgi:hypothetical protein